MKSVPCFRCNGSGQYHDRQCFTCVGKGTLDAAQVEYLEVWLLDAMERFVLTKGLKGIGQREGRWQLQQLSDTELS